MIYKTIFIDGPSVNSYLASVVQLTNKLVPDYARGKDMQENLSFTHATGQIFFTALVLDLSALYSRGPAVISFQDKPTWSQRVAASKKKKNRKGLRPLRICVNFSLLSFPRAWQKRRIPPTLQGKYTICRVENGIPSNICAAYFPPWENAPSERRASSPTRGGGGGRG